MSRRTYRTSGGRNYPLPGAYKTTDEYVAMFIELNNYRT